MFVVSSHENDHLFLGRCGVCSEHAVVAGEEVFVVTFRLQPGACQIDMKAFCKHKLAVLPQRGPDMPWEFVPLAIRDPSVALLVD